jgi:hypothetical protein
MSLEDEFGAGIPADLRQARREDFERPSRRERGRPPRRKSLLDWIGLRTSLSHIGLERTRDLGVEQAIRAPARGVALRSARIFADLTIAAPFNHNRPRPVRGGNVAGHAVARGER